jgi:hypothetical protein
MGRVIQWLSQYGGTSPLNGNTQKDSLYHHKVLSDTEQPCKSCREWYTKCDGKRPRCSHCLKEQVDVFLCRVGEG